MAIDSSPAHTAKALLKPLESSLLHLLRSLVRIDTVAVPPSGNEGAGQELLKTYLETQGLAPELYDVGFLKNSSHPYVRADRDYTGRNNLQLLLQGAGRGKSLLLNGHMDTVPPGVGPWSAGPWSGHIQDGRLYGLGSFDMKAGLTAQFGVACALHRAGIRLGGDLVCESVVDEEWGGGGGTLAGRLRGAGLDACNIAEGTQLEIYRATRGGAVIDLTVEAGDPRNYFSRSELISPAPHLGRLLHWVETWIERRARVKASGPYSHFPDPAPLQILAVESNLIRSDIPLSVPHKAAIRLYFQFLPHEDAAAVLEAARDSLQQFAQSDDFFRAHPVTWTPFYDPPLLGHELAQEHPWTACLARNVTECLGEPATVTAAPYPCDAFVLQREFGIPTLLFGPRGAGAHNPDEYVEIDSVMAAAESLLAAALEWCGA